MICMVTKPTTNIQTDYTQCWERKREKFHVDGWRWNKRNLCAMASKFSFAYVVQWKSVSFKVFTFKTWVPINKSPIKWHSQLHQKQASSSTPLSNTKGYLFIKFKFQSICFSKLNMNFMNDPTHNQVRKLTIVGTICLKTIRLGC